MDISWKQRSQNSKQPTDGQLLLTENVQPLRKGEATEPGRTSQAAGQGTEHPAAPAPVPEAQGVKKLKHFTKGQDPEHVPHLSIPHGRALEAASYAGVTGTAEDMAPALRYGVLTAGVAYGC